MKSLTEDPPARYEPFRHRSSLFGLPEAFDLGCNRRTEIDAQDVAGNDVQDG